MSVIRFPDGAELPVTAPPAGAVVAVGIFTRVPGCAQVPRPFPVEQYLDQRRSTYQALIRRRLLGILEAGGTLDIDGILALTSAAFIEGVNSHRDAMQVLFSEMDLRAMQGHEEGGN